MINDKTNTEIINKSNNKEMNFRERDIEDIRKEYFEIRELVESIDIKNKFKGENK